MQDKITKVLTHFSLTEPEISIYFAILSLKRPTATDIAKKVAMNRTTAYFHINHLVERGLLKEGRDGKVKTYQALPPSELASSLQKMVTDFKSYVPFLELSAVFEKEKPIIEIVESREGYLKIYDALGSLPVGSFFRVFEGRSGWKQEVDLITNEVLKGFFQNLIERNIETRALFTTEALAEIQQLISKENYSLMAARKMQLRTVSENILPMVDVAFVYGSKVSFCFPTTSMVLTITHKNLANLMGVMFDGLFALAEKVENPWAQA